VALPWFRGVRITPHVTAFAFLALFGWLVWAGRPTVSSATSTEPTAPVTSELVGPWTATSLPVDERAIQVLETDDVALREYRMGDEPPVWFAQVGGFGNRAAFHPPELCYVGSHFEVFERGPVTVMVNGQARKVMRLVIQQDQQRFEAWYWFTANGRVTPNYYQQQLWLLADAIRRKPMSGTLVRISTPIDHPASAHRRLLAFVTSLDASQRKQFARHGL
jgi:EpsI family protein